MSEVNYDTNFPTVVWRCGGVAVCMHTISFYVMFVWFTSARKVMKSVGLQGGEGGGVAGAVLSKNLSVCNCSTVFVVE